MAIPSPCGEMANRLPRWNRSITLHPMAAVMARPEITG